jgi:peptidoglycan hydrolase-like protein with peptidoglycan-binding domain
VVALSVLVAIVGLAPVASAQPGAAGAPVAFSLTGRSPVDPLSGGLAVVGAIIKALEAGVASHSTTKMPVAPTVPVPPTVPVAPIVPAAPAAPAVPAANLGLGSQGPGVLAFQQRLTALGYWLGTPDGSFGATTRQAVWALQKAAGIPVTGIEDTATEAALAARTLPTPHSTVGYVIEVNRSTGLLMFVNDGTVVNVLNASTGGGYVYYDHGVRGVAITPEGQFTTYRVIDGFDVAPLGVLYRPRFFVGGYAIHGDSYVPAQPVSHGCVRVSDAAINWIWATNNDPIGTSVWVY